VRELWQSGHVDVTETIANSAVLAKNIADGKTAAFDLTRK
jgi:NTE family protein